MRLTVSILLLFISAMITGVMAQSVDTTLVTIDRIYKTGDFRGQWFGPAEWQKDGTYITRERSKEVKGGMDMWKVNPKNDQKKLVVSAKELIPQGAEKPLRIAGYSWSADGSKMLIFTNTRRVWRRHTRGDYWVFHMKSRTLQKLGQGLPASSLMFAKFSPDGSRVAYVSKHNIYVENLKDGTRQQLTHDGTETLINGTFDWVYEEEFGLRDGFRWSPDGKRIAFWQLDASGVGLFYMINNTDSLYPKLIPVQYPKVGTTNSACRVGVVELQSSKITWMKVPGDPRNHYIAFMEWAANSDELVIQHLNRLQNSNSVMLCSAKDGSVQTLLSDSDEAWLDVVTDFKWLKKGKDFIWVSEKDGWRHVYRISRDGKKEKKITAGNYDVIRVLKIDDKKGWLYFIASPDNATQRYLYRIKLSGKGKAQRLTPRKQSGTHSYQISQDGKYAFHYYSAAGKVNTIDLVSLPAHKRVKMLVDNAKLQKRVDALKKSPVEFFKVKIEDGVELDGYMMKPYNFDPNKKYPVLFYVYGEPAGQTVLDRWGGSQYLWHLMLTQQGYIVMSVDNRGTPAPRGRAWRKAIYGKIGVVASADQAAAVREIRKWKFVDSTRIGVWGWSGGGSSTLNAMFRYPKLYQTGMAVAPVTVDSLYDSAYEERYMGLPSTNKEGYLKASPITYAKNLQGALLLVHGTGDDNVHYQNTEILINELIKYNKMFDLMIYPNRTHSIYLGPNTRRHLFNTLTRYLTTHLPAGPR